MELNNFNMELNTFKMELNTRLSPHIFGHFLYWDCRLYYIIDIIKGYLPIVEHERVVPSRIVPSNIIRLIL